MFGPLPRTHGALRRGAARRGAAAALGLLTLAACSSSQQTAPTATAVVTRATITTGVSATGSLSALTTQDLGFVRGGQLKSVKVKVGDRVREGQTLATIDTFALKQTVHQQEANLASQEAALKRLQKDPAVSGNSSTLAQAQAVVAATQHQVNVSVDADTSAIHQARKQLAVDEDAEDSAQDARHDVKKACKASQHDTTSADAIKALQTEYLKELQTDPTRASATLAALTLAVQTSTTNAGASACSGVISAEAAVTGATQRVAATRAALDATKQKKRIDIASGKLAVANTRSAVVAAENGASSTSSGRPYGIDQQTALVSSARSLLASARKDLADATLTAPFAGTVSAINGTVGEFLSPSTGTTALAPGSGAAIPGADTAAGSAAGSASVDRPGGSQFLVISDIARLQVVLPFEESDAAQIKPAQKVSVSFDAVPDLVEQGTVASVAPTGTSIAGVISYYVTVRLDGSDPRLKDGQTARVTVLTQNRPNVLSVPNDAVRQQGAQSAVVVVDPSGAQRSVTFQAGLVGPDRTEVVSGLAAGQRVVSQKGN